MKTFVFVHLFNDRSGSPKVLAHSIKALHAHGYSIELLTSNHREGFLDNLPGNRRSIFYKRSENKALTLLFYVVSQIFLFFYCFRYIHRDVVFYVNTMMPCGAAVAAYLMRKQVVYHVHETSLRPRILKKTLRAVIQICASKVIFVSKYLSAVERFRSIPQVVVYNALDCVELKNNFRQKDGYDKFNVLMVCSLKTYKGVVEFIRLARHMQACEDVFFTLVLNADCEEIESSIMLRDLPHNVAVYSRQVEVSRFYERASLLVNLSRPDEWIETFGLTVLEGMAYHLPVIVPPIGGPAEFVEDGKQGYLISSYETEKLADTIMTLAADRTHYENLARSAYQKASEFDMKNFEKNIIKAVQ
ncbi:glycosyltransferase family 4 protein [Pseudomonas guariconensis]|uniref:glycosyltransferase family 4 protein n=1 Tax=Pseudomonas guariconensis TaxID=1288410 RepID=UPI0018AC3F93|nr:glycosyltransferase family 4 protein [Pseudomonas guariconensis]MBF8742360.1 glycosyltransferase family 4 protein [Pseudomonas guariconensis]MBF8751529.1 glycosyltransferase family 4 protein [Pseudomonas guariconensis]